MKDHQFVGQIRADDIDSTFLLLDFAPFAWEKGTRLVSNRQWLDHFPGMHMHGHKNGPKTLLKLGPILWSGADDGAIRRGVGSLGRISGYNCIIMKS